VSVLDEARRLLARWAAGQVTDPDVWSQHGPRLLAAVTCRLSAADRVAAAARASLDGGSPDVLVDALDAYYTTEETS
jgi:hypothetical protein